MGIWFVSVIDGTALVSALLFQLFLQARHLYKTLAITVAIGER